MINDSIADLKNSSGTSLSLPLVYIVILTWNRRDDTLECVRSVLELQYPHYRVLVVDNASTDGTLADIRSLFTVVETIKNPNNLGFATGNNVGIRYALDQGADYILLLNNDTVVHTQMLKELVAIAETRKDAGIIIPKIYYFGQNRRVWSAGAKWRSFPPRVTIIGLGQEDGPAFNRIEEVDYATGCAMLIRRRVFEEIGLLDTDFFMYQEDYDFSFRVRRGRFKIVYVPTAIMWHKVSMSTGEGSPRKWYLWARSVVTLYRKLYPRRYGIPLTCFLTWVVLREIAKRNLSFLRPLVAGIRDGVLDTRCRISNHLFLVF
jgi:GT2 family glycosyltransferase